MITWELVFAVATYNFVMYVTPGPNNAILTTSGIKFGFLKTLPNLFGIPSGHGLQLMLVCLGLGSLFIAFPILLEILRYVGATYLLYLSYKMIGSLAIKTNDESSRPLTFFEAIMFQFVNPKAWIICTTAVSIFYPQDTNIFVGTFFMVFMSTIVNLPSISIWAFGGSIIGRYLKNMKLKKILEYLLAGMLVFTSFYIIFN
ncbi:LysE family translocator [Alphaproteobacteria bacterium]|nr:LysE family translocator [Alphaproteobacteria bacterium]